MFKSIWVYREFIIGCIKREFLAKYKGSVLGTVWSILEPMAMIVVYTVIFSEVMKTKLVGMGNDGMAYSIYLCAGTLTWGFFAESVNSCINVFASNGNIIKKLSFPRICLPVISIGSAFLNFCISYGIFFVVLFLLDRFPWGNVAFIIPLLIIQTIFAVSFGIGLGVLNVFFRDVGKLFNVVLQFWFWFTPIVYPSSIIPIEIAELVNWNPMYYIIKGYQSVFVFYKMPDFESCMYVLLLSCFLGGASFRLYKKHAGEMVDEL